MSGKKNRASGRSKGNVTLRDIARELNISHATVSLALSDNARLSEETKLRVRAKAAEMGYRQDPILSALSYHRRAQQETPRQTTLAWINPMRRAKDFYLVEEYDLYWKGAQEAAKELGFQLEEFPVEDVALEDMNTLFQQQNIRGVVIAPVTDRSVVVDWSTFPWKDYSVIRFGRCEEGPSADFITSAQVANTNVAFSRILGKGYKRIGFVGSGGRQRQFLAGYLSCQYEVPEAARLAPLLVGAGDELLSLDGLGRWMDANRPDAILTDVGELPVMLEELGFSIPEEVGLATLSIYDTPIDAGIDQNPKVIGGTVIRALVSLLNEHHFGIPAIRSSILVDGQWVDGAMLPVRAPLGLL